jgi:aminoglycoside phosphotransferase family enzyme/predicted kinase
MAAPSEPAAVAETHISWVFFAGERAYKLLKPVATPFLDFSTPELRERACRREVELNRRLAPDVYLGVSPLLEGDRVADHLIVMRRLPASRRLSRLAGTAEFLDRVREVARTVAVFHARLPPDPDAARVSNRDAVLTLWTEQNLDQMTGLTGPDGREVHDAGVLAEIRHRAVRYLEGREELFDRRIAEGHAVDGHGDLLADDIFCLDDGPRILDCLAFDDDLRRGDVLADLAFLAMDLEHLPDGPAAARVLVEAYDEFTDDHHPRSLLHLWIAYRALVRAKVRGLRSVQGDDADCRHAAGEAARFLDQCLEHLRAATVRLVLVGGAPGTGKSTVAEGLADALGATVLGSDELRKDLAGIAHDDHTGADLDTGPYAPAVTDRTYRELVRRAGELLRLGESVVLDASWTRSAHRDLARTAARDSAAELVELRCVLAPEVAAQRVRRRGELQRSGRGGGPSDATPEVARALAARAEPWPEAVEVPTAGTVDEAVAAALEAVTTR